MAVIAVGLGIVVFSKKTDAPATNSVPDSSAEINNTQAEFTDACAIFTKTQVEAAYGSSFTNPRADGSSVSADGLKGKSCVIDQVVPDTVQGLQDRISLKVSYDTYKNDDNAQEALEKTKSGAEVSGRVYFVKTDVPNVGDEAFFFQNQTPAVLKNEDYLYARKGNQVIHIVAVKLSGIDHVVSQAAIIKLAEEALR